MSHPSRTSPEAVLHGRWTVGFTGHRKLEQPEAVAGAVMEALGELLANRPLGKWRGVSSAAAGADLAFGKAVLAAGGAWHVLLPFPASGFRRDFEPEAWAEAEELMRCARLVEVLAAEAPPAGPERDAAYLRCGKATVEAADVLLAVWDGAPARGSGGTADVVAYAASLGKRCRVLDPRRLTAAWVGPA